MIEEEAQRPGMAVNRTMTPAALSRGNGNSMRVPGVDAKHVGGHDGGDDDDSVPSVLSSTGDDALVKQSPCESASTPDTGSGIPVPKAARKASSQKPAAAVPAKQLFDHLPDATADATSQFQVIGDCLYGSKHMGSSDHDAFDCDCAEEWRDGVNLSCGEDSDCINRATKMECVEGDCNCGEGCQNQRFQRKQYARVSVIKTEKKGFGLRADADLQPNDFIFEYIGEVINEPTFRRRMRQYDEEGIKHFYFMSLTKSEFVDATRKGNLGRFCNHSCSPNCYVDKWVVGDKLRMGIFAGRFIQAGEELVFDYNVDRYGADPQPCYCGEPNCTGFIGGKTQTERATKLSQATIEALGIDDPDGWDTVVAKKQAPRRKKPNEDDEEYVSGLQQSNLAEDGVTKVMAALMQCKEKWIAVKLLARIQTARNDERVLQRVVRMHGYEILRAILTTFADDANVLLQVLDILYLFPRLTKNKISDSHIETVVETLTTSENDEVAAAAQRLLDAWAKLETAYRIPRKKPNAKGASNQASSSFEDRRGGSNHDSDGASTPATRARVPVSPMRGVPKGPRSNVPQRGNNFFGHHHMGTGSNTIRVQRRPKNNGPPSIGNSNGTGTANANANANDTLPAGWFSTSDPNGNVYFYTKAGVTTWVRPTQPAEKAPNKAQQEKDAVQEIIDSLTKESLRPSANPTPQRATSGTPVPEAKKDKWRSLPLDKQKKIYENTLYPHIKSVTDKFRNRLPREEIKKFGKDLSKKLVASDYKNNRVEDPHHITERQEKNVKAYVRSFFERAVEKYNERERRAKSASVAGMTDGGTADHGAADDTTTSSSSPTERKRKRAESSLGTPGEDAAQQEPAAAEDPSLKRLRAGAEDGHHGHGHGHGHGHDDSNNSNNSNAVDSSSPSPPPPPPPPAADEDTVAQQQRAQDEAALQRENEEAMRDYEQQGGLAAAAGVGAI